MTAGSFGLVLAALGPACTERTLVEELDDAASTGSALPMDPQPDVPPPGPSVVRLDAVSATHQAAIAGEQVEAPTVRVLGDGVPLAGVTVRFSVEDAYGSTVSEDAAVSDEHGIATAGSWRLGPYRADYEVFASYADDPQVPGTAFSASATSSFDIVLHGTDALDEAVREDLDRAVRRWEGAIVGAQPAYAGNLAELAAWCGTDAPARWVEHRGLHVFVDIEPLVGAAGLGGVCARRSNGSPAFGVITLDSGRVRRLADDGVLERLMMHELGHTLGVGVLWDDYGLIAAGPPPAFIGPGAQAEFEAAIEHTGYVGQGVPVEDDIAGSKGSHWSEAVCGAELMTPVLNGTVDPLSSVTLASVDDLGFYEVNLLAADVWLPRPNLKLEADGRGEVRCGGAPG